MLECSACMLFLVNACMFFLYLFPSITAHAFMFSFLHVLRACLSADHGSGWHPHPPIFACMPYDCMLFVHVLCMHVIRCLFPVIDLHACFGTLHHLRACRLQACFACMLCKNTFACMALRACSSCMSFPACLLSYAINIYHSVFTFTTISENACMHIRFHTCSHIFLCHFYMLAYIFVHVFPICFFRSIFAFFPCKHTKTFIFFQTLGNADEIRLFEHFYDLRACHRMKKSPCIGKHVLIPWNQER